MTNLIDMVIRNLSRPSTELNYWRRVERGWLVWLNCYFCCLAGSFHLLFCLKSFCLRVFGFGLFCRSLLPVSKSTPGNPPCHGLVWVEHRLR